MNDLITWLRGVLDEDERVARAAQDQMPADWRVEVLKAADPSSAKLAISDLVTTFHHGWVLADIAAKRAILDEILEDLRAMHSAIIYFEGDEYGDPGGIPAAADKLVRLLASAYAHRDGFRDEWRPA